MNRLTESTIRDLDRDLPKNLDGLYLRGSIVRGEVGTGDVDLVVIGDQDQADLIPDFYRDDIPINPTFKTIDELDEIYHSSPRSWEMLTDIVPIRENAEATTVIKKRREWFEAAQLGIYISYLSTEHDWVSQNPIPQPDIYTTYKKASGSRRSVMRTLFTLKSLNPEAFEILDTNQAIQHFQSKEMLPDWYLKDFSSLMQMLSEVRSGHSINEEDWLRIGSRIEDVNVSVMHTAYEECQPTLDKRLADTLEISKSANITATDIESFIRSFESYDDAEKWLLLFCLVTNTHTNHEQLSFIASIVPNGDEFKDIHRAVSYRMSSFVTKA